MAEPILITGQSGAGKSTLIKTLDPKSTFYFNTVKKSLPFRGWKAHYKEWNGTDGNMVSAMRDYGELRVALKQISDFMPEIKDVVLDDHQYIMAYYLLDRKSEVGFAKFVNLADCVVRFVDFIKEELREDMTVTLLNHVDFDESNGEVIGVKAKVSGKMIEQQFTFEGLFTYVFMIEKVNAGKDKVEYKLKVNGAAGDRIKCGELYPGIVYKEPDLNQVLSDLRKYEYATA